jgi:phage tail sheath protein FI
MPIVQAGSINTTALYVPNLYVQIVPPQSTVINGVPTDILGLVGVASWGPVGTPVIGGDSSDYAAAFGPVINRTYDMGTHTVIAEQQGAANFRWVRVTDGTDVAATATFFASVTFTALYTGSLGNNLQFTFGPGSATGTSRLVISLPGFTSEIYDNIAGTGLTLWTNMVAAVNNGTTSGLRPPSQFVRATLVSGAAGSVPSTATTYGMTVQSNVTAVTAGTDGVSGVTDNTLVGSDTLPRKGMYALRKQGCGVVVLCDVTTYSTFTLQAAFGLSEGCYMICQDPAGSALSSTGIATAITNKQGAGLDSYGAKLMFGDWLYWYDAVNAVTRLVSPQSFAAGKLVSLSPEQSSLNKQLVGILGSQKSGVVGSGQMMTYADADLTALFQAGFDVISNPQPGGAYWGVRCGHNSSSNAAINGDNYTRLTNYIAATLAAGMGLYVGEVINMGLLMNISATLNSFLGNLVQQGILALTLTGKQPFSVVCDATNNTLARTSLGYVQADVSIQYQAINEKFIVNLQGGQTVQIATTNT